MHTEIVILLAIISAYLFIICLVMYRKIKNNDEYMNDPTAAFKVIADWCNNVHVGSDLDRLEHEFKIGLKVLENRKKMSGS